MQVLFSHKPTTTKAGKNSSLKRHMGLGMPLDNQACPPMAGLSPGIQVPHADKLALVRSPLRVKLERMHRMGMANLKQGTRKTHMSVIREPETSVPCFERSPFNPVDLGTRGVFREALESLGEARVQRRSLGTVATPTQRREELAPLIRGSVVPC